jgi:hypothetical protein
MKTFHFFKHIFSIALICLYYCCPAQNTETIAEAKSYYILALNAFNKAQYEMAIENCLVSISEVPSPLTYYVLTSAYAKNGNVKAAFTYANITLKIKPPLSGIYRSKTISIQQWAMNELQKSGAPAPPVTDDNDESVSLIGEAITGVGTPNFVIPPPSVDENAFSEQENNPSRTDSTFKRTIIFNPEQPQGTTPVYDDYNNKVGEITFYGFTGGQMNGTALTFSLLVKSIENIEQVNSAMLKNSIVFRANELNVGSVKKISIGMLVFKATILAVNKAGADRYYMRSVKVVVNTYPVSFMHAKMFR